MEGSGLSGAMLELVLVAGMLATGIGSLTPSRFTWYTYRPRPPRRGPEGLAGIGPRPRTAADSAAS